MTCFLLHFSDKENNCDKKLPHGHRHHHPSHVSLSHHHHHSQPSQVESNICAGPELEALDDAASLVHCVAFTGQGVDGHTNLDLDSNYSSDTESSPESVFSACSGRSHATYHPRGASSEPWVIAPPPCFTGSQVGMLSPVAASPLENLLIEHPSMSVYLSVPHSALPASHPFLPTTSPTGDSALVEAQDTRSVQDRDSTPASLNSFNQAPGPTTQDVSRVNMPRPPSSSPRSGGVIHHETASLQEMARITRAAQQLQHCTAQKAFTAQRCKRQNQVRDIKSHPKGKSNNRRNKHEHASGAKCARYGQRM